MSFNRQIQSQFHNLFHAVRTWQLPTCINGLRARVAVMTLLVVFSSAYIFQTSSTGVSGYKLHELENNIAQLNGEIQKLETESISYSSIKNIQERVKSTDMVAVARINHLTPMEVVAVR
jgi:allophanate hydrolase subunit 1